MGKEILFLNSFMKTNHQAKDDSSEEHFLKESVGDHCKLSRFQADSNPDSSI